MTNNGPVLIIDDDEKLRELVEEYLVEYDYKVHTLPSGMKAVETISDISPCVVILDVMMPGKDGLEVLRDIRATSSVPVIMLTAKGEDMDRIIGLELGADDYIAKPFNPRELLARIKAVLRRSEAVSPVRQQGARTIEAGGMILNVAKQTLIIDGDEMEIAPTEFRLLKVLMSHVDTAMTRDELMDMVWDKDFSAYDRSIDVHISKLRSMLKKYEKHAKRIKTVWGTGYMFIGDA
ncbi:response regulator transcription factor [Pseudodesulfovibrio sp. zrk46]|uniref:response regulator n=1 Tax=Pseudodesulfovibrio sp. zrk46 TaxID=2725288 RepID=UPI00144938F7|nr:response regulator transcription factor [Pseudodesulfovibrio sp. zrk46]QJB55626.1 response regulator transcription factor [Pseudodesulfovibrio sp. zrk46]